VPIPRGQVRRTIAEHVLPQRIGAAAEKELDHFRVTVPGRNVERCPFNLVCHLEHFGVACDATLHCDHVAAFRDAQRIEPPHDPYRERARAQDSEDYFPHLRALFLHTRAPRA
jgi:hypothetical protein